MQTKPQNVASNCKYWIVLKLQARTLAHLLRSPFPIWCRTQPSDDVGITIEIAFLFGKPNWFIFMLNSSRTLSPSAGGDMVQVAGYSPKLLSSWLVPLYFTGYYRRQRAAEAELAAIRSIYAE